MMSKMSADSTKKDPFEEPEEERNRLLFFGTNLAKIPCFKTSFMNGIGSGMLVGVAYNLATSRNPYKLALGTYTVVLFGSWFVCRYKYRKAEMEMRLLQTHMNDYHLMEASERQDVETEWARSGIEKKTRIKNLRTD